MAYTFQEEVEARLEISLGGVVTTADVDQYLQDGILEIYNLLKKSGAMDELRLFLGSTEDIVSYKISSASSATPSVFVTVGTHGWSVGDLISLHGLTANSELNDTIQRIGTVVPPSSLTFENVYLTTPEASSGTLVELQAKTNLVANPVKYLHDKVYNAGYVLVERRHTETKNTFYKEGIKEVWYACREVTIDNLNKVYDPSSSQVATNRSPVFWRTENNGEINVYPEPSVSNPVRVWGLKQYRDIAFDDDVSSYTDFPDAYFPVLTYYVIAQVARQYMSKEINSFSALNWSSLTLVTRLADAAPSVPYGLGTIVGTPPTFTKPDAYDGMASPYAQIDVFLGDDDSELSTAAAQKLSAQIQNYAQEIQNELGKYTKEAKVWETTVSHQFKDADGDLQALIAEFQNEVARYQTNVQAYAQEVQEQAGKVTSLVQKFSGSISAWGAIATTYEQKFLGLIAQRSPQQQPKEGVKDAG